MKEQLINNFTRRLAKQSNNLPALSLSKGGYIVENRYKIIGINCMKPDQEKLRDQESPEAEAEEELLKLGVATVPENIRVVLELQKTSQHPRGFDDIVKAETLEQAEKAMEEKGIEHFVHAEDPHLWVHCKIAMKMVEFMPIADEKKADLKLILLYHDYGKTAPGMEYRREIKDIQRKELARGKLYKVTKGHASEKLEETEAGFRANGISGRKLEVFMTVVRNHMETSLPEMSGAKSVNLFEGFGETDEEKRGVAELLAWTIQADSNATSHLKFTDRRELGIEFKDNRTGLDFEKIWSKYLDAKRD